MAVARVKRAEIELLNRDRRDVAPEKTSGAVAACRLRRWAHGFRTDEFVARGKKHLGDGAKFSQSESDQVLNHVRALSGLTRRRRVGVSGDVGRRVSLDSAVRRKPNRVWGRRGPLLEFESISHGTLINYRTLL